MRNLFLNTFFGLIFSLSFVFSASVAHAEGPQKVDKAMKQRARLNDEVLRLSQPLKCSADTDCATLAMGSKPCGGPWKYVLYSKKNAKVSALKKKLAEYNKLDQKQANASNMISDCSLAMEPTVACVNSMCVDTANANAANAKAGLENVGTPPTPAPTH